MFGFLVFGLDTGERGGGLPGSSAGKELACNAGDPGSIPGSGRSSGEGIGYLLQYSWASLVAELIKNPPAMWETWVRSLGWEDPLEKGKIYVRSARKQSSPSLSPHYGLSILLGLPMWR